ESEELLDHYAWYLMNAGGHAHPVGSLKPNDAGLFDAHGSLWEWCLNRPQKQPIADGGPVEDKEDSRDLVDIEDQNRDIRRVRGGFFKGVAFFTRSSFRNSNDRSDRNNFYMGLRLARTVSYP